MQRSLIGPIVGFGELAGCAQTTIDGPWAPDWTPWQLSLQPVRAQNSTPIYCSTCVYVKHAVGCID